MVNHLNTPSISWDENLSAQEILDIANLISDTLIVPLPFPAKDQSQLFFVIPTPTPYKKAEQELLAKKDMQEISNSHLKVVALPNNGKCYAIDGRNAFSKFIPHAFQLGTPELTLLAANCLFNLTSNEITISNFVINTLKKDQVTQSPVTGMHFDSDDLIEIF